MDFQIFIVGLIIFFATLYGGLAVWRKSKSFSAKKKCENDCNCGSK